jgi:hypothetical protein
VERRRFLRRRCLRLLGVDAGQVGCRASGGHSRLPGYPPFRGELRASWSLTGFCATPGTDCADRQAPLMAFRRGGGGDRRRLAGQPSFLENCRFLGVPGKASCDQSIFSTYFVCSAVKSRADLENRRGTLRCRTTSPIYLGVLLPETTGSVARTAPLFCNCRSRSPVVVYQRFEH